MSGGFELSLRGIRVGSLPSLPETVDFTHVTHLTLCNLDLTSMPEGFLSRFGGVTHLDLSGNQLTAIPNELEHLTQLTELHLPGNQIVIDAQGSQRIAGLRRLQVLTLDHNPIGGVPELSRLAWLHSLSARDCGLSELPLGVLRHANLVLADLRDNAIVELSDEAIHLLQVRPSRINLHDNPLSPDAVERLQELLQAHSHMLRALMSGLWRVMPGWTVLLAPSVRGAVRNGSVWSRRKEQGIYFGFWLTYLVPVTRLISRRNCAAGFGKSSKLACTTLKCARRCSSKRRGRAVAPIRCC